MEMEKQDKDVYVWRLYAAPVEVNEVTKETLKCERQTDDQETKKAKKNPFSVTINLKVNS